MIGCGLLGIAVGCRGTSQWVKGKPLLSGVSQARAMMAQACSGLILAGAPERGASPERSRASAEVSALERQRARHWLTVLRQTSRRAR